MSQRGKLRLFSQKSESKFMRLSRKTKKIMLTWHNAGTYTHACGIGGLLTSPNDSPEYNCVLETTHFVLEKGENKSASKLTKLTNCSTQKP